MKILSVSAILWLAAILNATELPLRPGAKGFPEGWRSYGRGKGSVRFEKNALRITDQSNTGEFGICRTVSIKAPGTYEFVVKAGGSTSGAQLVAIVGKKVLSRRLTPVPDNAKAAEYTLRLSVPAGCKTVPVYIYGTYKGMPDLLVYSAKFRTLRLLTEADIKGISKLKDLHLTTPLDKALIVPGDSPELRRAARQIARKTKSKIIDAKDVKFPLTSHLVLLGNRFNNGAINTLYRRGFCFTDTRYPGKGGYELRSIHNISGGGFNVILCGGSDDAGAVKAAELLLRQPLKTGHLMQIHVPGFKKPYNAYDHGNYYVSSGGYYGWNYLASMAALFYQTGDTFYAKEFLRLAFPDEKAKRDFKKFNGESIELPDDPLAGPYHYCGSQMILLWDLIEEHPVFTDKERLAVTLAFERQYKHHIKYVAGPWYPKLVDSRHGQWVYISLYALARYFNRDYPAAKWQDALELVKKGFRAANDPDGWIKGELGIVPWFITGSINPSLTYFLLAGDKSFTPAGALARAIRFFEILWDGSGRCEVYKTARRQIFNMAAEYTGDKKFLYYADRMPKLSETRFMLGAGFMPSEEQKARPPVELLNRWTAVPMSKTERLLQKITAPAEKTFRGAGWRDTLDTTGDWISFNCFNEGYRTPFKLLSLYGLRIDGTPFLYGLGNFVQIYRGGTTGKEIPVLGEIHYMGSAGTCAGFSGVVPRHAFSSWKRNLLLRKRKFALIADTVTPSGKGSDLTVAVNFQTARQSVTDPAHPDRVRLEYKGVNYPVRTMRLRTIPARKISSGPRNTLFETAAPGDKCIIEFYLPQKRVGNFSLLLYDHNTRAGMLKITLDGKTVSSTISHYSPGKTLKEHYVPLNVKSLARGRHKLEISVVNRHPDSPAAWIGAGSLVFQPVSSKEPSITTAGAVFVRRSADDVVAKRNIPSIPGRPVTTFSLLTSTLPGRRITAVPHGANGAFFRTPEPMYVFCGKDPQVGSGEMLLLEQKSISGFGIRSIGSSFKASSPVMLDWEFGKTLSLSGKPGTVCTVNCKEYRIGRRGALTLDNLTPDDALKFQTLLEKAPRTAQSTVNKTKAVPLKKVTSVMATGVPLTFIEPFEKGFLAGAGPTLLVFDKNMHLIRQLRMSAKVLCAAYSSGRYFAGAVDDELAAFAPDGRKLWSFKSKLAGEIEATQKFYWFKPVNPGVISLAVRDGKVYAGSACTMEVVDAHTGKLIVRLAQGWGPCRKIIIIPQPDGSYNAAGLRYDNTQGIGMWTRNSRSKKHQQMYSRNLPGFRNFNSWGSLFRTGAFTGDFDGDGKIELMADAQGMYCWINCYAADGTPKYQINLGPGDKNMKRVITDWCTGDFHGSSAPEAALVTVMDQLLALSGKCEALWNIDLPFRPEKVAIDPGRREIAVTGGGIFARVSGNGRILELCRLPEKAALLWHSSGKWYAACGECIFKLD